MREIPLTQGYVALVDDEDYEALSAFRWHVSRRKSSLYACRNIELAVGKRPVLMHRVLLGCGRVDHRDGDGLNNQRSNLRQATSTENQRNQRAQIGKSSIYKGVGLHAQRSIWWVARIVVNRRRISLGVHRTEEAAARAYDAAARLHFGAFAALNFPEPGEQGAHRTEIGAA